MGDEIVVDEIDRGGQAACHHLVELGGDLLRRLEARVAAVQRRDVAELALVGAAAGELDAAEEVAVELRQLVGRHREFGQLAPLDAWSDDLALRPRRIARQPVEQLVGGVAQLADMKVVEIGIVLRAGRDRRAAQHRGAVDAWARRRMS